MCSFKNVQLPAKFAQFLPARRCASAVSAITLCLSVCLSLCPSQVGLLSKRLNGSNLFLTQRLPLTYPTLYWRVIWISSKIRVLYYGTWSPTLDFRKFCNCTSTVACMVSTYVDTQRDKLATVVGHQFITPSVHLCVQHDGREACSASRRSVCSRWDLWNWNGTLKYITQARRDSY